MVNGQKQELESVVETTMDDLEEENLSPETSDVYVDDGELWTNIKLADVEGRSLQQRREEAMQILKDNLSEADISLPTVVNANYQLDVAERDIAVWWNINN